MDNERHLWGSDSEPQQAARGEEYRRWSERVEMAQYAAAFTSSLHFRDLEISEASGASDAHAGGGVLLLNLPRCGYIPALSPGCLCA